MKSMKIGLHVPDDKAINGNTEMDLVTDSGKLIDFAVCNIEAPNYTLEQSKEIAAKLADTFAERNISFFFNCEYANWKLDCTASDGCRWAYDGDGCHRAAFPDEFIKVLGKNGNFDGVMYDEFEHILLNRNPTIQLITKMRKIIPVFPLLKTKDPVEQGEYLTGQLKDYTASIKKQGAPALLGEHNYPVMFHKFAECGITPNYKSLKENLSNIAFAMASGAALQYGLPLYNCADNWFMMTNPGHSADEMYHNLLFAYHAGVDCAYVESVSVMTDNGKLTPHGEAFKKFCEEYKGKDRGYSNCDYRPEIGIIHYDDSFWGQWYPILFKKALFGNPKIKPDSRSREIFRIFNIITHGETCKRGFSWGRFSLWSMRKHFSFVSMNSTAVFDHNADEKVLDSLKLCFLCGLHISEKTLAAVEKAVKEKGLTAVTPKRFAPENIASEAKGSLSEIPDGKGKWIVVKNYKTKKLKTAVKDFLGNKGEIRLTFAGKEVRLKLNKDKNSFEVL